MSYPGYNSLNVYYGDLHSHCHQAGYGYGSVEEAYRNARAQLDFASVTAHAYWPDIPEQEPRLASVVSYHKDGFRRAAEAWDQLQEATESAYEPDRFVTFLSCEWHSMRHGDHNVYFKDGQGQIIRAADLDEMRATLRQLKQQGIECCLIPHHIGYLAGYRGINWADFTPEFSPVVEMFSMHGQAESDDAPYPYLHSMGPRDERSTMQYGLRTGRIFGVMGSTDHHSAFPGSYGYGRVAVWAGKLTRDSIWEALTSRRTYALTGDRIALTFSVNGQPMGSILPDAQERLAEVNVLGGDALDYVEVLHNNRVLHHWRPQPAGNGSFSGPVKVLVEVGWGEKGEVFDWEVELAVTNGRLVSVEPRFRGPDILAPRDAGKDIRVASEWQRSGQEGVRFTTQTWGNPTVVTPATQAVCLEIMGQPDTEIRGQINDRQVRLSLNDLALGARTGYLHGFLSPAYSFHRAIPKTEYAGSFTLNHKAVGQGRDWYYVRVRQKNGQWAWSSPIWIEPAP